jgi:hypothetical protein
MHEHDGGTPLQLIEKRLQNRVTEVDAAGVAEQHDAVEAKLVEGVGQFDQRRIDVRQGQAGKAAEPVGMVADQLGGQLVAPPGQRAGGGVVTGVHAGGADRRDGHVDAGVVEERQRAGPGPGRRRDAANRVVARVGGLPEEVGQHVVVKVHGERHAGLRP